eukprot:4382636-Lingulodinium_polyedra.AAC.1
MARAAPGARKRRARSRGGCRRWGATPPPQGAVYPEPARGLVGRADRPEDPRGHAGSAQRQSHGAERDV